MASLIRRGRIFYVQYSSGGKPRRVSLKTDSLQIAKDKLRQVESAQLREEGSPLPTRTSVAQVLTAYIADIRCRKPAKSAQTEVYYLREMFGPVCEAVRITGRTVTEKSRKRALLPPKAGQDRRRRAVTIEASCFEQITTVQVAAFISGKVQSRGLAPKTANHYRQILVRLFNWARTQMGLRMTGNPAAGVERYRERAPQISFLSLPQIDEQLGALEGHHQIKTMVAMMIYAGLRREELTWLTGADVDLEVKPYGVIYVRAKTVRDQSWEPKTRVNRAVPISSMLRAFIDKYTRRPSKGEWYFPSPKGTWWDPDNFSSDLRELQKKKGLLWSALDFRHSFGSHLAMKGESLYKISTLMGNSPEICRRHYAALSQESLVETVEFPKVQEVSRVA